MDANQMLADMRRRICILEKVLKEANVGGGFWNLEGNSDVLENNFLGTVEDDDLVIKTNNVERARITSGGLFGIGASDPSVQLDINGQIRIRGGSPGVGKVLVSDVNGVGTWVTSGAVSIQAIVPFISTDFDPDGITVTDATLNGRNYEVFLNDLNRFLYNEVGNQEWDYVVGGGFRILLPGFDANAIFPHLYIIFK